MSERTVGPVPAAEVGRLGRAVLESVGTVVVGKGEALRLVLAGILAGGNVLLEDLPGLGKTLTARSFAQALGLDFRRLQFTPDLLPGDITGGHILEEQGSGRRALVFHPGPVFANVLLADEINRASPKTQSALLEAMQEGRVTVLGETRELPRPFFVLATQNPIELEGTYPLPEAQLDRFLFKLEVEGVGRATLERILNERRAGRPPELESVAGPEELARLFTAVDAIYLPRAVAAFIARLVEATHPLSSLASERVRTYVRHGASPRAAIAIGEAARAHALLGGKPNVGFDDVREVAVPAIAHRLVLDYRARLDGLSASDLVRSLLEEISELEEEPPGGLDGR